MSEVVYDPKKKGKYTFFNSEGDEFSCFADNYGVVKFSIESVRELVGYLGFKEENGPVS